LKRGKYPFKNLFKIACPTLAGGFCFSSPGADPFGWRVLLYAGESFSCSGTGFCWLCMGAEGERFKPQKRLLIYNKKKGSVFYHSLFCHFLIKKANRNIVPNYYIFVAKFDL